MLIFHGTFCLVTLVEISVLYFKMNIRGLAVGCIIEIIFGYHCYVLHQLHCHLLKQGLENYSSDKNAEQEYFDPERLADSYEKFNT